MEREPHLDVGQAVERTSGTPTSAVSSSLAIANAAMLHVKRELRGKPLSERFPSIPAAAFDLYPAFFEEARGRIVCEEPAVKALLEAGGVGDFMRYTRTCAPDLGLRDFEINAFLAFRREVGNVIAYHDRIPHLRNHHRFARRALDALVANWKDRSRKRPLRLVVVSGSDHNGFLNRNPGVEEAVADPSSLALVIETTGGLEAPKALFDPIARDYGQHGKIDELLLVAHASPESMSLGGNTVSAPDGPPKTGAGREANPQLAHAALRVGEPDDLTDLGTAFTVDFFDTAIAQMKSDPDHPAMITLLGCHTDTVDVVRPPHDRGPGRNAARDLMLKQTNLAQFVRQQVARSGKSIDVVGAAQFAKKTDHLLAPGGAHLAPHNPLDPAAYAVDKNEYVVRGTNFVDVFAAVQSAWVKGRPQLAAAIHERLRTPVATPWEPLIAAMFQIILPQIENPRVITDMHELASVLNLLDGKFMPWKVLLEWPLVWRETTFRGLSHCDVWKKGQVRVAFLQSWMAVDASQDARFFDEVSVMPPAELATWVYPRLLTPMLPRLLRHPSKSPPSAELKLALAIVTNCLHERPLIPETVQRYLRAVLGEASHFAVDLKPYLVPGISDDDILGAIGKGPGVAKAPPLSALPTKLVGKPGRIKTPTILRTGPSDAYAAESTLVPLAVDTPVVVDRVLTIDGQVPEKSWWFFVLAKQGSGWVKGDAVERTEGPPSGDAESAVAKGDPQAPVRVLLTGFSGDANVAPDASAEIINVLAGAALPGVVLTTKTVAMTWRGVDHFVDAELAAAHADVVLGLGVGQGDRPEGGAGVKEFAFNRRSHVDNDGVDGGDRPISDRDSLLRRTSLPMEKILADQKRQLGKNGLARHAYVGSEDTDVCNYLAYRELAALHGGGAMVGFVHVSDGRKDIAAVVQVIRSAVEEVRVRRAAQVKTPTP